jgi:DMSO/TMAO reductase YedYZ molybdopterin-dependent catalytic subunit
MKERRFTRLFLAAVLVLTAIPLLGGAAAAVPGAGTRVVDSATGATPNYRTFLKPDLKSMPVDGGNYTCLKASAPFTYFKQEWFGVPLSYLMDTEVGLKAGTTGIKVIADDGYSTTLTLAELRMTNPDGLHTLLAWKNGAQNTTGGPYQELPNSEGPFRLVVPQATIGPHGVGTDNWNRAVQRVRAIEVQPTPPGLPSADASKIPPGQVMVYGNVQNRRTFTVDSLKSIKSYSGTYKWLNSFPTHSQSKLVGIPLPYFLQKPVGLLAGSTNVTAVGVDGFSVTFTMNQASMTYPDGNQMLIAWNENGADLKPTPVPGGGPLKIARPQTSVSDVNKSEWVSNLRVLRVDPSPTGDAGPAGPAVPADRLIVCGNSDPRNVPSTWYLAEGYTGGGFEEWICIGNPNPWKTQVEITYMVQGEGNKTQTVSVEALSRATVKANDTVGDGKSVSASVVGHEGDSIVVERAMYWNGKAGGHCAAAVNSAAKGWYLAEGSTAGGFETWVLVQNPGNTGAIVKVNYMNASGSVEGPTINMPANSRTTINVADTLPNDWQVSAQVTADVPVIAERAMYWGARKAGHDAVGVTGAGKEWFMAEGCTANGFETWVLLQNPGSSAAHATITYMNEAGQQAGPVVEIPARSRKTINVADTLPNDAQVSTKVVSDQPVIAERSVYWNGRQGGTCENAVDSPKFKSLLAEGATDGGFESWILVQNPGPADATVYITYLTGQGPVERAPLSVPAGKRVSINEFDDVGANIQVSAQVNSSTPVAVERAVYWNNRTEGTCSKGYLTW